MESVGSGPNSFRWPAEEDIIDYKKQDILCTIDAPFPNGTFYRNEPVYSFSNETLEHISMAYGLNFSP